MEMPRPLFPHRPDFMQHQKLSLKNEPDEEALIYHSQKILGKLYRAIRLTSREEDNQILKEAPELDARYIPAGEDDHILIKLIDDLEACGLDAGRQETDVADRELAWYAMHTYASDLRHIAYTNTMNSGHPLSEHELFIGTILHGALPTKAKNELIARVKLQCNELIDGVLRRLEGTDGRVTPQLWTNRVLAALRVAVSQSGNFGAQTFGLLAVRSTLYLLELMKDVNPVGMMGYDYSEDMPFEPVGRGHYADTDAETDADASDGAVVAEDAGGEGVQWGHASVARDDVDLL